MQESWNENKRWYMKTTFELSFLECFKLLFIRKFTVKFISPFGGADASCRIERIEE